MFSIFIFLSFFLNFFIGETIYHTKEINLILQNVSEAIIPVNYSFLLNILVSISIAVNIFIYVFVFVVALLFILVYFNIKSFIENSPYLNDRMGNSKVTYTTDDCICNCNRNNCKYTKLNRAILKWLK